LNPTPIEEARHALTLSAVAVVEACRSDAADARLAGRTILTAIHRFVRTVIGNVHLSRARADCCLEYLGGRGAILKRKVDLVRRVHHFRQGAQERFPVLAESADPASLPADDLYSLARFDVLVSRILENGGDVDEGDVSDPQAETGEVVEVLRTLLTEWLPSKGVARSDRNLVDLLSEIRAMHNEMTQVRRAQSLIEQVHPATRWNDLESIVADVNPSVDSKEWLLAHAAQIAPYRAYYRFLFEPRAVEPEDLAWLEAFKQQISADVRTVRADLETRLGTRASFAWLLDRYARRCRWLRLRELQAALKGEIRDKERFLTRDAATFLFDAGFDVLTEQSLGQHRYDVIGKELIVEAKIYKEGRSSFKAVVEGLQQIHSYVTALSNEGLSLEPILLVFRIDGPVADLPREHTVGTLNVAIVQVDLGSSSESGSKARAPIVVTPDAIAGRLYTAHGQVQSMRVRQPRRGRPWHKPNRRRAR
jgi:hypothetical protein